MTNATLPSKREMIQAFESRDTSYDGIFVTGVTSTGIFCRPSCPARKPRRDRVKFFPKARDALVAGFRPCLRCRPLEPGGGVPAWLEDLMDRIESDPSHRWTDSELRRLGIDPVRARRWFKRHHGMTFQAYQRARRLGLALGAIEQGSSATHAAFDHGFESESGFRDAFLKLYGQSPVRNGGPIPAVGTRITTPLGPMIAATTDQGICLLEFADRKGLEGQLKRLSSRLGTVVTPGSHPLLSRLTSELEQYFEGARTSFEVPLQLAGTPFQEQVWQGLREIPYGATESYAQLAHRIGRPSARRAVGRANGDNRLAILLPCHRVVGADGRLTGYGGGLWRKRYLLDLESENASAA